MTGLYLPAGSTAEGIFDVVVTPDSAGWEFSSLRILPLHAGVPVGFSTGDDEMIALPLSGGCAVTVEGTTLVLDGRPDVFAGVTDFAYLPKGSAVEVVSEAGAVLSLPGARAGRRLPFRYGPASDVPVELRGAGACSRQVNNFAVPHSESGTAFETDKLIACEVITPAGNWSSYPPHKHDVVSATESELEEIYYYAFGPHAPTWPGPRAGGYQRVYGTADRPIEVLEEVADGDVVLIPHGWHGPAIASPAADMYYLNVMAGPAAERAWRISDDPDHGWIRETWRDQPVDPRLPFYTAPAPSTAGGDRR